MKKFTKVFMSLIVSLAIICGVISIIVALDDFAPKKPPQITYGEFPFYVENLKSELWLDYGSPEYYMGDSTGKGASFEYRETWKISEKGTNTEDTRLNQKELEKYFGIEI